MALSTLKSDILDDLVLGALSTPPPPPKKTPPQLGCKKGLSIKLQFWMFLMKKTNKDQCSLLQFHYKFICKQGLKLTFFVILLLTIQACVSIF